MENNKGLTMKACIMIAIGGMVGSSIFTLSGLTYGMAGASAILTWAIAGAVLLLYALNLAELATTFPQSGGIFIFPHKVLGKTSVSKDLFGWIAAWSWLNVSIFGSAFSAICVSTYLQEFVPILKNSVALQMIIPIVWIVFTWWINAKSINAMGKIHNILTICLMSVLAIYIVIGFTHGDVQNITPFVSGSMGGSGIVAGIPIAMLAYGSIIAVASIAGEIQNPKRNIPKIIVTAVATTVVMYCAILFATFLMAPVGDFMADPGRQYYPLAYALGVGIGGAKYGWIISIVPLAALLALTTNMSVMVLDASRTVMAISKSGFLPKKLGELHPKKQTPVAALTVVAITAAVLTLKPDLIWLIINTGSICSAITVAMIAITLMTLRKKQKTGEIIERGEFTVPGGSLFPIITLVVILITLVLLYFGDGGPMSFLMTLLWYAIGFIIFGMRYFTQKKNHKEM